MGKNLLEIARLAGVSKTTVSLVINGKASGYRISKKTEKKIRDIVERENFTPDQYARGFRLKKTQTLGLVVPDFTNWFFSQICFETEWFARHHHHQVFIACSDDDEETEFKVVQNLIDRRIDGLIVASVMKKDQMTQEISNYNIPVVYIDRRIENDSVSWVTSDNFQGTYELVSHMCSKKLMDLCFLGGLQNISTSQHRLQGYRKALEDHGIAYDPAKVFQGDYTREAGFYLAREMVEKRKGFPQAFLTGSLTLLEGALQFIKKTLGNIPNTLQIGTFDDHPFLDFLSVRVPSVRQDSRRISRSALEMISGALSGKRIIQQKIIKPRLIIR
jgi:LacI family transcriptional regulator, sucrose operon repressor